VQCPTGMFAAGACPGSFELDLKLIQTRMIQKPLLWVEKWAKVLVCLWGFANCASLRLLDMTRNAPHFWTFSLGAWSASYGLVGLRHFLHGMLNRGLKIWCRLVYRAAVTFLRLLPNLSTQVGEQLALFLMGLQTKLAVAVTGTPSLT
jgi:hypothetical protein